MRYPSRTEPVGLEASRCSPRQRVRFEGIQSIVLIGTNTPPDRTMRSSAKGFLGAETGATLDGMPKEDDINVSSNGASSNGSDPPGFTRFGFVDEADRLEVEAQQARMKEVAEELEAEGVDGTAEYEKLLVHFGISAT
jgi:hypothetical protein